MPYNEPPIPLANMTPLAESQNAGPGTSRAAARPDHTHPSVSSRQRKTTDANGVVTFVYSRTFDTAPVIIPQVVNDTGRAISIQVADIKTGALWTGCTVTARRGQALPAIATLLNLGGLDLFAGPMAANVEISLIAILPTL